MAKNHGFCVKKMSYLYKYEQTVNKKRDSPEM